MLSGPFNDMWTMSHNCFMDFRKFIFACAAVAFTAACTSVPGGNGDREMDRFISGLMKQMTVREKAGQLNLPTAGEITTGEARSSADADRIRRGEIGGLFNIKGYEKIREIQRIAVEESRLGIPLLFGMDVVHGYETVFPIPLGLSCSWDMDAVEESARIAAAEASADGICWTYSPMVDISRDPRWGRIAEGSGEDPFLGSAIAAAMVRGYQGDGSADCLAEPGHMMACVKHFALYGASEAGRDYNTVDMSRQRMFNEYFEPYKAAVDAGAGSVMMSFNEVEGIPATANKWLMQDVLRDRWGFDGFVVSDYTGVMEMVAHGIGDMESVSLRAIEAGLDMDMVSEGLFKYVEQGIEEGKISMDVLDNACRRVLEAKYRLGLFDDPYRYCRPEDVEKLVFCDSHRAAARRIAAESFVLLKNEGSLLPLRKAGTVAVIGPLADTRANMAGTWSVAARLDSCVSVMDGLKECVGDKVELLYAKGSNLIGDREYEARATVFGREIPRDGRSDAQLLSEALATAARADVVVAVLGEASEMSGECSSRSDIGLPDVQRKLLKALVATGKPVVLVLFNGRPLTLCWEDENVPAILDVWFGGSETGHAVADVLFGDVNPCGKLTMSFPKNVGQIPLYYAHKNTGRPLDKGKWFQKFRSNYLDVDNDPLYPFGYGLSYTSFEYGDVVLSSAEMDADGQVTASVEVRNTGSRKGKEIVQMYIRDMVASSTRPVRELKGFRKVELDAGESCTVEFPVDADLLGFYNHDLEKVVEPGEFRIFIGGSSTVSDYAVLTVK